MQMPSDNEGKHTPRSWSVPSLHAAGEAFACDFKPRAIKYCSSKAAQPIPREDSGTESSSSDNNKSPAFVSPTKKRRKAARESSWTHYEQERSLSEEEHMREPRLALKLSSASLSKSFTDVTNTAYLVPDWSAAGEEYMDDVESSSDVKDDNELEEVKNDDDTATLVDSASGTTRIIKSNECMASVSMAMPHSLSKFATGDGKSMPLHGPASLSGEEYLNLCSVELLENETPPKLWSSDASCAEDLTDQCPLSSSLKTSECLEGSKASLCVEGLMSDEEVDTHLANAAEFVVRSIIQEQAKVVVHAKEETKQADIERDVKQDAQKEEPHENHMSTSKESHISCQKFDRVEGKSSTLEKPSLLPYSSSSVKICSQTEILNANLGLSRDRQSLNLKIENCDRLTSKQHSCPMIDINATSYKDETEACQQKPWGKSHSAHLQTKDGYLINNSDSFRNSQVHVTTSDAEVDKQMTACRVHSGSNRASSSEGLPVASRDSHKISPSSESGRVLTISIEKLQQLRKRNGNSSRVPVATRESFTKRYDDADVEIPEDKMENSILDNTLPSARHVDWTKMSNAEMATEVIRLVVEDVARKSCPNLPKSTVKKSALVSGKTDRAINDNINKSLDSYSKSPIGSSSAGALGKPHVSFSRNSSSESMESSSRISLKVDDTTHSESICTTSTLEKSSNSLQAVILGPSITIKDKTSVVHPLTTSGNPVLLSHRHEEQSASSWVKKRARPHSANINRDALQDTVNRPVQLSTSSNVQRQRQKSSYKGCAAVEKSCFEVRSDECISSASVVSPSGASENVDVDSPSWSNESVSKYREFAKMRKRELLARFVAERRHREELDQLLAQLHDSYDKLLAKHAEAENTIDQLRLGKPMKFETSRLSPQVHFMHSANAAQVGHDHQPKSHSNLAASPKSRHLEIKTQESRNPGRRSIAVGANLVPQLEGLSLLRHVKDNSCQTEIMPISVQESFRSSVASLLLRANCLLEQVNSLHECIVEGISIDPVVGQQMCTYLWESLVSLQRDVVAHSSQAASLEDIALEDAKTLLVKIQGRLLSLHPKDTNLTFSLGKSLAAVQQLPSHLETSLAESMKLSATAKMSLSLPATGDPSFYGSLPASPSASSHSHRTETYADGDSGCHSTDKHDHSSLGGDIKTSGVDFEPTVRKSSSSCFSEDKLESKSSNESECIDVVKTLLRAIHSEEVRSNLSKRSGPPRVSPKGSGNSDSDLEFMCGNSFNFPAFDESNLFVPNESKEAESSSKNSLKTIQTADDNHLWTLEPSNVELNKERTDSKTTVKSCESLLVKPPESVRADEMKCSSDTAVGNLSSQTGLQSGGTISLPDAASASCDLTSDNKLSNSPLYTPHSVDVCDSKPTDQKKILDTVRILSCQNLNDSTCPLALSSTKQSCNDVASQCTPSVECNAEESYLENVNTPAQDQKSNMEELYCHAAEIQKVCDMLREKLHSLHTTPSDSLGGPESSKPSKEDVVMQLLEEVRQRLAGVTGNGLEEEASSEGRMEDSRAQSSLKLGDVQAVNSLLSETVPLETEASLACGDTPVKDKTLGSVLQLQGNEFVDPCTHPDVASEKNGGGEAPTMKSSPRHWCEFPSEAAFCTPSATTYVYLADDSDSRVVLEKLHDLIQELRHEILAKKIHTEGDSLSRTCSQSCQTDDFPCEVAPNTGVKRTMECCSDLSLAKCNHCNTVACEGALNYLGVNEFSYFGGRSQVCEAPRDTLVHYCGLHHIVQHQANEVKHLDVPEGGKGEATASNCPLCLQVIKPGRTVLSQEETASSDKLILTDDAPTENCVCSQVLLLRPTDAQLSHSCQQPAASNNDSSNSLSQPTSPDTYPSVGETVDSYAEPENSKYAENSTPTAESVRNSKNTTFCPLSLSHVIEHHIASNSSTKTPCDTSSEGEKVDQTTIVASQLSDSYKQQPKEDNVAQFGVGVQTQFSSNSPWTEDDSDSSEDETINESPLGVLQLQSDRSTMARYSAMQFPAGSPSFSEEQSWSSHHWMNSYAAKELMEVAQTRRHGMRSEFGKGDDRMTELQQREAGLRVQHSENSLYDCIPSESSEIKIQDAATLTSPGGGTDATNPNSCGASPELGSPVHAELSIDASCNQSPQHSFPMQQSTSPTSHCPSPFIQKMAEETAASQSSREFNLSTINEASDDMENDSPIMMSTGKDLIMCDEESGETPMETLNDQVALAVCCVKSEEQIGSRPSSVPAEKNCNEGEEMADSMEEDESAREELQLTSVGIQAEVSQRDADIQAWPSRRDMDTQMTITPHGSQETDAEVSTISKEDGDNTEEEATFPGSEVSAPSRHEAVPAPSDSSHCIKRGSKRQQTMSGSESPKERSRRPRSKRVTKPSKHLCQSSSSATSQAPTPDESSLPTEQHSCKSCARLLRKTEALANTMLKELKNEPLSCDESSEEDMEVKKLQLVHALDLANKIAKRLKHHSVQMLHSLNSDGDLVSRDEI